MPHNRINTLQGLRFFFIFSVLVFHLFGKEYDFFGCLGVSYFFVLSGFILSWAYSSGIQDGSFRTRVFFPHQLAKLYPLHFVMLMLIAAAYLHAGQHVSPVRFFLNVFLVQTWLPPYFGGVHGSTWFLCDILFFYLCFRRLCTLVMKAQLTQLVVAALLVLGIYGVILHSANSREYVDSIIYPNPLLRLIDCSLGIVLFRFYRSETGMRLQARIRSVKAVWCDVLCILLLVLVFVMYGLFLFQIPYSVGQVSFFWPLMVLVVFWYASVDKRDDILSVRILSSRVFLFLGNISMELYLTHEFVAIVVNSIASRLGLYYTHHSLVIAFEIGLMILVAWIASIAVKKVTPMVQRAFGKFFN